ncbi:MAG: sensor domain-containing diguanylate cyclase [Acidobacteriota bacterium]
MIEFHSLEPQALERFLERQKSGFSLRGQIDLNVLLRQILQKSFEFVPSESGSILLDDPVTKVAAREENELIFIAAFGSAARNLMRKSMSARNGIVGRVYQTGTPYLSADVDHDQFFFSKIDETIGHKSQSIVCVPIYIGKEVCGVLELINRLDGQPFSDRDMVLLEIFAGYTSFTLQNALDAKHANELAKKDDLTGLYNDRWFHVMLSEILFEAQAGGLECVLMFMDLDNFKSVNDTHGHLVGSQVLRETGILLKRVIDRAGAVISRYGGDEFVMILPDCSTEEGLRYAEEVRKAIEETVYLSRTYGYGLPALRLRNIVTASIGVAVYHDVGDGESIDTEKSELLSRADGAMYEAKSQGKNRVVVGEPAARARETDF